MTLLRLLGYGLLLTPDNINCKTYAILYCKTYTIAGHVYAGFKVTLFKLYSSICKSLKGNMGVNTAFCEHMPILQYCTYNSEQNALAQERGKTSF